MCSEENSGHLLCAFSSLNAILEFSRESQNVMVPPAPAEVKPSSVAAGTMTFRTGIG